MFTRILILVAALFLSACGSAESTPTVEAPTSSDPPTQLALVDGGPLCDAIGSILDNLLAGDIGSASDYADLEQELPAELRGNVTTGPIPTVSPETRAEAEAVDAHTTEQCGMPFVQSIIHTAITCEAIGTKAMLSQHLSDWGSCSDPRLVPGSMLSLTAQMDELEVLERAITGRAG
ncbi:MAG: hypothetical protein R8J94_19595 [Acidimicrobiia bacterium]|nr:hypothetical protein [Acidimicrobiia bacterium]